MSWWGVDVVYESVYEKGRGHRREYRHRQGTGLISGIVEHLASCQRAPQNALLLVQVSLARVTRPYRYPDMAEMHVGGGAESQISDEGRS